MSDGMDRENDSRPVSAEEKQILDECVVLIARGFVKEVERRAEEKMLLTHKLEGAHYAAMKELLAEMEAAIK